MVVDDSAVIRGLISRWLEADSMIQVVASAHNGAMALRNLVSSGAEVVILDVEMPEMDGMTALPKIIEAAPHVQVIMASTLTRRNAEISIRAMSAGAADYIPKPESNREVNAAQHFRHELLEKVKALGAVARGRLRKGQTQGQSPRPAAPRPAVTPVTPPVMQSRVALRPERPAVLTLQKPSSVLPRIVTIGSSTGGPQALFKVLGGLGKGISVPLLITQHMPPTFTTILADHLARATGIPCHEGRDGERIEPGTIYLAPGDFHMTLEDRATGPIIRLNQEQPENYCRPSVDPMLRSVLKIYGPATLSVILTGMGSDGLSGCRDVVQAGGSVIAQDEASSVVWGMPGAVSNAGLASAILPLDDISGTITRYLQGVRR
ncbi:chemotaxis response regulator protein-glutamate methylesterase [Alphaproteobacteria bacterium LMG 31809]|uniref:Protein-glutamate methylesterase/protein-glutamine glutaminase n=2 Tax=Govanella unica TaxID=2975056 RepID=A0A9X3TWR8_9PROT|nr:chemotaxis response regulator protein-glutamate methylesterase [Govania unica]MDA5193168.1 chemotaxis response regulator protein-glutamate methylesterase [Govania unica]